MKKKIDKKMSGKKGWMFWTPRIVSIVFILFLTLFSLDVFDGNYGFWGTVLVLFMHGIPSIVLALFLIIFWNKGVVPGVVFILGGSAYIFALLINPEREWYMLLWALQISGPAFFVGILFILDWKRRKKQSNIEKRK